VQRKLKDAGRFVFLSDVRGLSYFRDAIPSSLRYAGRALAALPDLAGVREVLERHIPELRADAGGDLRV
jgi:aminoglycoside/choline kinase family phosphotransferase